jgi:hypothetical protein
MQAKTPIAVFTYNRPEHTRKMLQSLVICAQLDECDVYIYSDATRIPEHAQRVDEVRALVRAWGGEHGAKVIEQENNLGLARSIVSGVTELCEQYGRVIVVEDDLVLHPGFLHYMLSALDRYENEDRVAQISGYMFPVENPEIPDTFFLSLTSTWGWATWQRVWKKIDWLAIGAQDALQKVNLRQQFDIDDTYPFSKMLNEKLQGKNQSWGILFYWWVFSKNLLVLFPRQSLVFNAGMDGSGYHSSPQGKRYVLKAQYDVIQNVENFDFPEQLGYNERAYRCVKKYLAQLTPNLFQKVYLRMILIAKFFVRKSL